MIQCLKLVKEEPMGTPTEFNKIKPIQKNENTELQNYGESNVKSLHDFPMNNSK